MFPVHNQLMFKTTGEPLHTEALIWQGSKLTFSFGSQLATNGKIFGPQIVNFGCQLILYKTYTRTQFYTLLCMQEKSQLKSENN